ncbi:hypothetical protein GN958_ATG19909 [Phytophthora infestans]|uniref:Uncharacterized protein n=1 Tax=Phytophthora infestans TaxID=4787 RepID=A0A8S9TWE3_PHYIN|nr:hypothetical protein GN958_ATG19909 [Phytophthora infestans]
MKKIQMVLADSRLDRVELLKILLNVYTVPRPHTYVVRYLDIAELLNEGTVVRPQR